MASIIEIAQGIGVFLAGLAARFGVFLVMVALLVVPAVALALGAHLLERRRRRALGLRPVAGVQFRPGARYAPGHTWLMARSSGSFAVGIDDIAERLLPAVSAVELARVGSSVDRGGVIATLHGGGRRLDIRSPIAGTVVGVNASAIRDPAVVKRDGYGRGWLVAIAPRDEAWMKLPAGPDAERWMRDEASRFARFVEDRLGIAAADGGELVAPAPWLAGEEGWRALAAEFVGA